MAEPDATSVIVWTLNTINDVNNNSIVFNDFGSRTGPWTPRPLHSFGCARLADDYPSHKRRKQ